MSFNMKEDELIVQLNAIRTTVDGGWRITFDCDASQSELITRLAHFRDCNLILTVKVEEESLGFEGPPDDY
jgi:hypothetical protein